MKRCVPNVVVILMLLFTGGSALRAQVSLVKDINVYPPQHNPINDYTSIFCNCGDYLFFPATTEKGRELWRTDGTADGTILVKDIAKGFQYGLPAALFCDGNGTVYFAGRDATNGYELWASDGTANGTRLVKDVTPGPAGAIGVLGFIEGNVYFISGLDTDQQEIWKSDGSANGTSLVAKLNADFSLSNVVSTGTHWLLSFFNNTQNRNELWSVDVASGTTEMLLENVWVTDSERVGDKVYLLISDQTDYSNSLWSSNGTISGTTKFKDFGSTHVQWLYLYNDELIISTSQDTWISDGTDAGTTLLTSGTVNAFAIVENKFYGVGFDFTLYANRLFEYDGSNLQSTVLNGSLGDIQIYREIPVLNNRLVMPYYDAAVGSEPGISNEARNDFSLIKDIYPGVEKSAPRAWAAYKDRIFFLANDPLYGSQIWSTDGTENGTMLLKQSSATGNAFLFSSARLAVSNQKLHFLASPAGDLYFDLFTTDGTEAGTLKKWDSDNNFAYFLGRADENLIYMSNRKLYKTSGADESVTLVKDLTNDLFGYGLNPTYYTLGDKLLFALNDYGGPTERGYEFWVTNGTEAGTHLLKEIYPGLTNGVSGNGVVVGSKFIFDGKDPVAGSELWVSDGSTSGTVLLKDIHAGSDSNPSNFCAFNDKVIFNATTADNGTEVWITDGTEQGTHLLADIVPGPGSSDAKDFRSLGNIVLFNAYDEAEGWRLWKTDGTTEGTALIADIIPGNDKVRFPSNLTAIGNKLYFTADDDVHGMELWVSDGTAGGTYLIDIASGMQGSDPSMFTVLENGIVYFKANGELWKTNGTALATVRVSEVEPLEMITMGNTLYLTAAHPDYGIELFKADFTKFDQQIVFDVLTNRTFGDAPFQIAAEASSGLPVTIISGEELTIEDHTATIVKPGTVEISVNQSGDDFFNPAQASQTICIVPNKPVITMTGLDIGEPVLTSSAPIGNQWFDNEDAISNEIGQMFHPSKDGRYKVNVTIDGCTSSFSDDAVIMIMGAETFGDMVSFFPNPVKETLRISTTGQVDRLSVMMTDANGKAMRRDDLEPNESVNYSLAGYPAGIYLIRIATGGKVFYGKIIKE